MENKVGWQESGFSFIFGLGMLVGVGASFVLYDAMWLRIWLLVMYAVIMICSGAGLAFSWCYSGKPAPFSRGYVLCIGLLGGVFTALTLFIILSTAEVPSWMSIMGLSPLAGIISVLLLPIVRPRIPIPLH